MKRGTGWPLAVVAILGATIGANLWLIRVAGNDPSFAVEENYYQRGVHWDDELAQRSRNAALGWRVAATVVPLGTGNGSSLRVALRDSLVQPLAGASVSVKAMHVARANDAVRVTLSPSGPGDYEARVPLERAGLWEIRIDVQRGPDRFTATERVDVRAGAQE